MFLCAYSMSSIGDYCGNGAGHPEFSVTFQNVLNEYRVANGSMSTEEKVDAEASMRKHPVDAENGMMLCQVLQAFLKRGS